MFLVQYGNIILKQFDFRIVFNITFVLKKHNFVFVGSGHVLGYFTNGQIFLTLQQIFSDNKIDTFLSIPKRGVLIFIIDLTWF